MQQLLCGFAGRYFDVSNVILRSRAGLSLASFVLVVSLKSHSKTKEKLESTAATVIKKVVHVWCVVSIEQPNRLVAPSLYPSSPQPRLERTEATFTSPPKRSTALAFSPRWIPFFIDPIVFA